MMTFMGLFSCFWHGSKMRAGEFLFIIYVERFDTTIFRLEMYWIYHA